MGIKKAICYFNSRKMIKKITNKYLQLINSTTKSIKITIKPVSLVMKIFKFVKMEIIKI